MGTRSNANDTLALQDIGIGDVVRRGAVYGVETWAAYAVAEALFSSVLPWALPLVGDYYVTNDAFTLFVTALYLAFGALSGAAAGLLLRAAGRALPRLGRLPAGRLLRAATTLGVAVTLLANFVRYAPELGLLALGAIWIVMIVLSTGSGTWARRIGALANPWPACLVLLGAQGLDSSAMLDLPRWRIAIGCAAYAGAVLLAATGQWRFGTRSPFRWAAGALAVVLVATFALNQSVPTAAAAATAFQPGNRPNVILITLDTVRADHLSLYGYARPTTPNLEQLARESVVYSEAVSAGNMTLSTHASIFTGLYPSRHGAHPSPERYWGMPLSSNFPSLPQLLLDQGYRTAAVVANYAYLATAFGFGRGFERYDARSAVPFLSPSRALFLRSRVRNYLTRFMPLRSFQALTRRADDINREAFAELDELRRDSRPFFLFINYMDAHWPYVPPPPYDSMYPGKAPRFTNARYFDMEDDLLALRREPTPAERSHLESQYDGALTYLDFEIGKLIERLKQTGVYSKTLLVITADHGEALGERSLIGHGLSVYQDQVHVPLLIKFPSGTRAVPAGTEVEDPVSSVDLLPTIFDTLAYSAPPGIQGRSLRSQAASQDLPRPVFSECFPALRLMNLHPRFKRVERAVFLGSLKLIRSTQGKRELYDLAQDPGEAQNVYASAGPSAGTLETSLVKWAEAAAGQAQTVPKLERGTVEKLRSLGYVQ